jgi:hypothetical protein
MLERQTNGRREGVDAPPMHVRNHRLVLASNSGAAAPDIGIVVAVDTGTLVRDSVAIIGPTFGKAVALGVENAEIRF